MTDKALYHVYLRTVVLIVIFAAIFPLIEFCEVARVLEAKVIINASFLTRILLSGFQISYSLVSLILRKI